jgi:hypothetical protein
MGTTARAVVDSLKQSPLANDFYIQETPVLYTSLT